MSDRRSCKRCGYRPPDSPAAPLHDFHVLNDIAASLEEIVQLLTPSSINVQYSGTWTAPPEELDTT